MKQNLSNNLRLNCRYLKIICFLHPRYHRKTTEDILKMHREQVFLFKWSHMISKNENEPENEKKEYIDTT